MNKVNYDIKDPNSNWAKTVHLNNMRTYDKRTESINKSVLPLIVRSACFVAEEDQSLTELPDQSPNSIQSCEHTLKNKSMTYYITTKNCLMLFQETPLFLFSPLFGQEPNSSEQITIPGSTSPTL